MAHSGRGPRTSPESEDRQVLERELAPLPADGVELAVVLDRVHEGVQPLQQVALSAADADAEVQRAAHDLHLVVLARIVAVQRSIDEKSRSHHVDLPGDHGLQPRGLVVEAHEVDLLGRGHGGQDEVLHRPAGHADAQSGEIVDALDVRLPGATSTAASVAYGMENQICWARSGVIPKRATTMSTRFVSRKGRRLAPVTDTNSTCTPRYFPTRRATSGSYPSGWPSLSMRPKMGVVVFTPITTFPRLMISSTVCAAAGPTTRHPENPRRSSRETSHTVRRRAGMSSPPHRGDGWSVFPVSGARARPAPRSPSGM